MTSEFRKIAPKSIPGLCTAETVSSGIPIPKTRRIELFSSNEWEDFTEEWAASLTSCYANARRFAGAGDKGLDVVGFVQDGTFAGGWDNYQCKHYNQPLAPSDIWVEIGKIIYYSFKGDFPPPRKHYFVAPKGIGTTLARLLADPGKLQTETKANWGKHCENGIGTGIEAKLSGDLLDYFSQFDFRIFSYKTAVDLINEHSKTPFHSVRFGGGLPIRPQVEKPPEEIKQTESRYIQQLLEAYSEHSSTKIDNTLALNQKPDLQDDFLRQRERFYHAESLRNFARDSVPPGTYESLQEEIFHGIVDICEAEHTDGLFRMRATTSQSAKIQIAASPLASVTKIQDKQGICHQLANEDRIKWVQNKKQTKKRRK